MKLITAIVKTLHPFQAQLKSGFSTIILFVAGAGLTLAMELILARLLGVEQFGLFISIYSLITLLTVFSKLGFDTALLRFLPAYEVQGRLDLITGITWRSNQWVLAMSLAISLLMAGLIAIFIDQKDPIFIFTAFLGCALLPLLSQAGVKQAALVGLGYPTVGLLPEKVIFPSLVIVGIFTLVVMTDLPKNSAVAMSVAVLAAVMALLFSTTVVHHRLTEKCRRTPRRYLNKEWIRSALPFSLLNLAQLGLSKTDIIMLGFLRSPEESGKYAAASLLASLVVFFINSGNRVVSVEFSRAYARKDHIKLQKLLTLSSSVFFLLSVPIILVLILFGKTALGFYGPVFTEAYGVMLILIAGQSMILVGGSVGFLLAMTDYHGLASRVVIATSLLNIVLNALLIPSHGMLGAALSTAVAISFRSGVLGFYVWKKLNIMPSPAAPLLLKWIQPKSYKR